MTNDLVTQLLHWYQQKHPNYAGSNMANAQSLLYLEQLAEQLLLPVQNQFGPISISYGFTSSPLLRYLIKHSPGDMGPSLDQHASLELNTRGNRICQRDGAACDFWVQGYETRMHIIAQYITESLPFDRLYFYGKDRPIHLSIGPENARYALLRYRNKNGIRVNGESGTGSTTPQLFIDL